MAVGGLLPTGVITVFALGVFAGAVGKSAQFPLHVWLPDAMEGPTPVSALIHAATMVAAGVYLVARLFPVFDASEAAMHTVAAIGGVTAILAASMGLVMTDIKRVLAYSTISQLGYMMLALGVGGYVAAIFHLFNHAFFKALLFLGSGSVNHSTHTFDMRLMGGLRRVMPVTMATFTIAGLSLAGIYPLAGFWSKDEILGHAWQDQKALFWIAFITVFLTALYIARVIFLTFGGEYRGGEQPAEGHGHAGEPHESPWVMALPLAVLAVPAVASGFANISGGVSHLLEGALPEGVEIHELSFSYGMAAASTAVALAGFLLAWLFYGVHVFSAEKVQRALAPLHTLVSNKYYMDHLYERVIVGTLFYRGVAFVLDLFDRLVVDGIVNGVAWGTGRAAAGLRRLQSGQVQAYGAVAFVGLLITLGLVLALNPP
jgi:NADH-quinone oxidoreductase subunit L